MDGDTPDLLAAGSVQPEAEGVTDQNERLLKWKRPPVPADLGEDKLVFQQIDIDHYIGAHLDGMPGARYG